MGKITLDVVSNGRLIVRILTIFFIILTIFPLYSFAAVFNVTHVIEFWDALRLAANNSEDDTINLAAGTYGTDGNPFGFSYFSAPTENFSLEIHGVGTGLVVLTGEGSDQVSIIDLTNLEDVSNTVIEISDLTIRLGGSRFDGDAGGLTIRANILESPDNLDDMPIVRVERVEFLNNDSDSDGGGANINGGVVIITDSIFKRNTANNSGGGAIVNGNELTFSNNIFIENVSDGQGGGLVAFSTDKIVLSNNIFKDNNSHMGGGARITAEFADISGNEFTGNIALFEGGGMGIFAGSINLTNNEFNGNSSWNSAGGGVQIKNMKTASLTNNIFNGNDAVTAGGGLYVEILGTGDGDYVATLTNNTCTLNTAEGNGGAIYISLSSLSSFPPLPPLRFILDIYNNIIFNNFSTGNGNDIIIRASGVLLTANLFNNDFSDFISRCNPGCVEEINQGNNIDEDPLFVDAEAGDVSLQADSPAIDAGDPDAPDVPSTDFFGNPRIPPPDMGAVEYIEEAVNGGGGCTLTHTPVTSSLAVFLAIPVLILIRRIAKKRRS